MTSGLIVLLIIVINTVIAVSIYLKDRVLKYNDMAKIHFIILLLCPLIGFAYFGIAYMLERFTKDKSLAYADISFDSTRHVKKMKSDFIEEIDILPLEEAFAVSKIKDRRYALLSTLKKDFKKNISTVVSGLNNEDSETSHYVASAVLTTSTEYLNLLGELKVEYNANTTDLEVINRYFNCLREFIESNIPDNVDKVKYARICSDLMENIYINFRDEINEVDIQFILKTLTGLKLYGLSEIWSERGIDMFPESDGIFYYSMKLYYDKGDKDSFLKILNYIKSSSINISNETLQIIRFFAFRQNTTSS